MPWVKSLPRHRIRRLCVFGFVLLLVALLVTEFEDLSDLKARAEKGDADAPGEWMSPEERSSSFLQLGVVNAQTATHRARILRIHV